MIANLYGNANKTEKKKKKNDDDDEFIDEKSSRKILELSRDQRREMEEEAAAGMAIQPQQKHARIQNKSSPSLFMRKNAKAEKEDNDSSDEDDDDDDEKDGSDDDEQEQEEDDELIMVEQDDLGYVNMSTKHIGLTPEEEALLSNMMGNSTSDQDIDTTTGQKTTRNLADIIMAKIQEKEAMAHRRREGKDDDDDDEDEEMMMELPPKVVQVSHSVHALMFSCPLVHHYFGIVCRRWTSHNIIHYSNC